MQGVGRVPFLGQVSGGSSRQIGQRRKPGDDPKADLLVTLPQGYAGIMAADAVGENWLADGEWAVYETPEEVGRVL